MRTPLGGRIPAACRWKCALVVTTLGTGDDEQYIDSLEGTYKETFLLHYNFPPYSVGETGRMGSPGRREIGHGKLAWRALQAVLPAPTDFPYTIRVVSEITESNGSSSMASVCGGCLALMDNPDLTVDELMQYIPGPDFPTAGIINVPTSSMAREVDLLLSTHAGP